MSSSWISSSQILKFLLHGGCWKNSSSKRSHALVLLLIDTQVPQFKCEDKKTTIPLWEVLFAFFPFEFLICNSKSANNKTAMKDSRTKCKQNGHGWWWNHRTLENQSTSLAHTNKIKPREVWPTALMHLHKLQTFLLEGCYPIQEEKQSAALRLLIQTSFFLLH